MQFSFQEESSEEYFPELQQLPSSVTYLDMKLIGSHRLTALGCQAGYLRCALVDLTSNGRTIVLNSSFTECNFVVTVVRINSLNVAPLRLMMHESFQKMFVIV